MLKVFISIFLMLATAIASASTAVPETAALKLPVVTVVHTIKPQSHFSTELRRDPSRAQEISDLLAQSAGVQIRSSGGLGAYAEASVRGSAARHVSVLFDGVPLQLAGGQAINLALFPAAVVDRAEIYRGGTPITLGVSGVAAINLLPPSSDEKRVALNTQYGSFASWRSAALWSWGGGLLSLGRAMSDNDFPILNPFKPFDPSDPERRRKESRKHAARSQNFGLLKQSWETHIGDFDAMFYGFDQAQQLPDRVNSSRPETQLNSALALANLRYRWAEDHHLSLQLQNFREHYKDPASNIGLGAQDQRMRSRRLGLSAGGDNARYGWFSRVAWQDYRSRDALDTDHKTRAQRREIELSGVYHAAAFKRGVVDLSAKLRVIDDELKTSSRAQADKQLWVFDPMLAWRWDFAQPKLAAGWRQSCDAIGHVGLRTREPGFIERYGDRGYLQGNPNLQSERMVLLDAGLSCAGRGWQIQAAVFGQDLSDAISFIYSAQGVGRAVNTDQAVIYGAEFESKFALSKRWKMHFNLTWLESEDRTQVRASRGRMLPGRAQHAAYTGLRYERLSWGGFYEFQYESGQFYDRSNLLEAPITRLHSVGLRYQKQALTSAFEVRNVLNQTHAQFNGFPRPGRSYFLTLNLVF